jgi:hypothetical protein
MQMEGSHFPPLVLYGIFHLPMIVPCREADVVGGWHVTCSGRASPCLQVFTGAHAALRNAKLWQGSYGFVFCALATASITLQRTEGSTCITRHCVTSRKVAGSISDEAIGFFNRPNPSSHIMSLGSTQPLTEMSTINLPGSKGRPAIGFFNRPNSSSHVMSLGSTQPLTEMSDGSVVWTVLHF